jgi:flagellin
VSLRINTNVEAFNAHRQLSATSMTMSKSMEKLSSGLRINRAADDAAGLAISEKMRAQVRGLAVAGRNALDGVSLIQSTEGALNEVHAIIQRVRELAVQYNNGTLSQADRAAITVEVGQLSAEIGRIIAGTQFNSINLLSLPASSTITLQVGANGGETIEVPGSGLGGGFFGSVFSMGTTGSWTADGADIGAVNAALSSVADVRARLGAYQNRLEHTIANLGVYQENLSAAESRIRDVDMALEMTSYTKLGILSQSGTSMLAQANQQPQSVLSLLQG